MSSSLTDGTMKRAIAFYIGLGSGISTTLAFISLHQDALGQEAYIAEVRSHWLSYWVSVPAALSLLVVTALLVLWTVYQCTMADFAEKFRSKD